MSYQPSFDSLVRPCRALFIECMGIGGLMVDYWAEKRLRSFIMWAADIGEPAHHTPPDNAILFDRNSQDTVRDTLSNLCQQLEGCKSYSKDMGMDESAEDSQTTPPTRGDDGPEANLLEKAKGDVESLLDELSGIVADCRARYASRLENADCQFEPELHAELERHLEAKLVDQGPSSSHTNSRSRSQPTSELSEIQKRLVNANLRRRNRFLFARQQYGGLDPVPNAPGATTISITKSAPFLLFAAAGGTAPRVEPPYYTLAPVLNVDRVDFRCPCCCRDLPGAHFSDVYRWKEHLDLDLRPYTCILPDCPNPDQLFATKELWESHGQRCHKVKEYFVCTLCQGCPVIPDETAWKAHTREAHRRGWPETRIPALMRRSKQCMPAELDACPICDWPKSENIQAGDWELVRHVANHIHNFALLALPWDTKGDLDEHIGGL